MARPTTRGVAGSLAILLLWTGPATAVVIPGQAVDASGKAVPNAQFVAQLDNGETSALQWRGDRRRGRCSHPAWGDLFEVNRVNGYAAQAELTTPQASGLVDAFRNAYEARTGTPLLIQRDSSVPLDDAWISGFNAGQHAVSDQWGWTVQAGMRFNWGLNEYGGSPLTGYADAGGHFTFDTDQFAQYGNPAYKTGDTVRAMAGLKCEGAVQYFQDPQQYNSLYKYFEPCANYCWLNYSQVKTGPDACSQIQLPPAVIPVQHAAGTPSPAAGGDAMADQWAFKKLGLPLQLPWDRLARVTVAVIDSGLDYRHPGFKAGNLWVNPEPGYDASYPDDVMGWNYILGHNNPWDDIGHGTFVAGLILAVNPRVRIMPIKVMDGFGGGLNSDIGAAVIYAVERGARVINLSVGTKGLSQLHQEVVDYARARGVVLVAAAGNEGENLDSYSPGGVRGVLTVAALDQNDKKPAFGNWGQNMAIAAPGVDIVSWRARNSDFVLVASGGKGYKAGDSIVPSNRWLYRASGTSFAAPFVTGAAALLFSLNPNLTGRQVERLLLQSADDVEVPGWDQITGAGRLNIARAVLSNPNLSLVAKVARIAPGQAGGQPAVQVFGTAEGTFLKSYQVQIGRGEAPTSWKTVAVQADKVVEDGLLAAFPLREITARGKWSVRVIVQDAGGRTREARGSLDIN